MSAGSVVDCQSIEGLKGLIVLHDGWSPEHYRCSYDCNLNFFYCKYFINEPSKWNV